MALSPLNINARGLRIRRWCAGGARRGGERAELAYLYLPNGIARGSWQPAKTGRGGKLLKLNEWMSPFEPFKDELIIPRDVWTPLGNGLVAEPQHLVVGAGSAA